MLGGPWGVLGEHWRGCKAPPPLPPPFYPLQALVACRRLRALHKLQPWPHVSLSSSSSQTSLPKADKAAPPADGGYSDLDCKILQLCGEVWGGRTGGENTTGLGGGEGGGGALKPLQCSPNTPPPPVPSQPPQGPPSILRGEENQGGGLGGDGGGHSG